MARGIFSRFGFKKTTMEDIARALHRGKSSIYNYFTSKEEIFKKVVEKESRQLKEEITNAVNQENTPQKKLRAYVISRMHVLQNLANFYSAIKDDYFEHYSFVEKLREKHLHDELELITEILKEGVEKGIFVIKDLDITAWAIITALKGFEYPWAVEQDVAKIEKNIDSLLEVLFNGIIKR